MKPYANTCDLHARCVCPCKKHKQLKRALRPQQHKAARQEAHRLIDAELAAA